MSLFGLSPPIFVTDLGNALNWYYILRCAIIRLTVCIYIPDSYFDCMLESLHRLRYLCGFLFILLFCWWVLDPKKCAWSCVGPFHFWKSIVVFSLRREPSSCVLSSLTKRFFLWPSAPECWVIFFSKESVRLFHNISAKLSSLWFWPTFRFLPFFTVCRFCLLCSLCS